MMAKCRFDFRVNDEVKSSLARVPANLTLGSSATFLSRIATHFQVTPTCCFSGSHASEDCNVTSAVIVQPLTSTATDSAVLEVLRFGNGVPLSAHTDSQIQCQIL